MMRPGRLALALSIAALLALPLAAEDLTVISKVTMGGKTTTGTQYMTSSKAKSSDGETDTIIDYPTGQMTFIEHKSKSYWETSLEEMAAYMDRLYKDVKNNPMLASMFGGPDSVTVVKGKGSRKIAGYACDDYTLNMGESFIFQICSAPSLQPPPQYYEGRKLSYAAMGPMGKRFAAMFDEMKKIKGFPLASDMEADMGMARVHVESEATEVRKGAIPASTFEVPAGYKKKASPFKR
jgi:Domain of unknown function (DUF4412)